jgi:acyl-CoA reductase-like NAD-dependent aldehyde dehydrogenase
VAVYVLSTVFKTEIAKRYADYAGFADKIGGEMFPEDGDSTYKLIRYEPLGVCAGISAWNATLVFVYWKIAPAVAAGNTVSTKSYSTLFMTEMMTDNGIH